MMTCDGVRLPQDAQQLMAGLDRRGRSQGARASAAYNPAARLSAVGGEGARAYVEQLARIHTEEETLERHAGPVGGARMQGRLNGRRDQRPQDRQDNSV